MKDERRKMKGGGTRPVAVMGRAFGVAGAVLVVLSLCACSSTQEVAQTTAPPVVQAEATPEPEPNAPPEAIPHEGPMRPEPDVYDCGQMADYDRCEFGILLTNDSTSPLTIEEVAQDFAVTARVGLVEDSTGFDRELPYEMAPSDRLRLLLSYRHVDPTEPIGGAMVVSYTFEGSNYRLVVPVGAR